MTNVGVLDNKGIEFTLNTVNLNLRNFQWTSLIQYLLQPQRDHPNSTTANRM